MTSLWRTCFSGLLALPVAAASLSGSVLLVDSQEGSGRKKKDFSGVVVWLEPVNGSVELLPPRTFTMRQKDKTFLPHVLAIPTGSTVDLPNLDPIFHNAFSNFAGQPFDTGLYPPGGTQKIRFRRPGIVRVFCNIHASMSAVIAVLDTPHFATTKKDGAFRIDGVPPGDYKLQVWHERATLETLDKLARKLQLAAGDVVLPPIEISESGFVQTPHKNKYGREYPPEPSDKGAYPGGRP